MKWSLIFVPCSPQLPVSQYKLKVHDPLKCAFPMISFTLHIQSPQPRLAVDKLKVYLEHGGSGERGVFQWDFSQSHHETKPGMKLSSQYQIFSRLLVWHQSWFALKNHFSAEDFRSYKGLSPAGAWPPKNPAKASQALGCDSLGTESFAASIWKLPKVYSLGLCFFTRFFSFFAKLFKSIPISWSSKINCCGKTHFID